MISFIVPAHNEERVIGTALAAIDSAARSLRRPFEIIVVDDASTDRTADLARAAGARVAPVNLRHIAAVRNAGAALANGDVLIFVDADTIVNARVVGGAVRALDSGAVGGGSLVRWDGPMPWWARLMEWTTVLWIRVARFAAGCFVFCTRDAFHAAGGFSEVHFAGEELYFSRALKRHGRFVILRESVLTSGRKFRTYTLSEIARMLLGLGWHPWRALRERKRLPLWYDARRERD